MGTGIDSENSSAEKYTPAEIFSDLRIFFNVSENLYLGPALHMRYAEMKKTEAGKILDSNSVPGSDGTVEKGFGAALCYDSRNSIFYPTDGIFIEISSILHRTEIGSEYSFHKTEADFRYFIGIHQEHVIALQFKGDFTGGNVPFQSMAGIGGSEIMRGLPVNRYMDKTGMALQGEYRFPLIWRFAGAIFAGAGSVQNSLYDYTVSDVVCTGGAGLRIILDRERRISARLDAGFNNQGEANIYFLVKEAF
jgi:outer membrane protein assembly factor BamA